MNKRYLSFLTAAAMLAAGTSCGSDDSFSDIDQSAAVSSVSTVSSASVSTGTETPPAVTEEPPPELPKMDQPMKQLDLGAFSGFPVDIRSNGDLAVLQCYSEDEDHNSIVKYYIIDAVKEKLLRVEEDIPPTEALVGLKTDGTVITENYQDDISYLRFYSPGGKQTELRISSYPRALVSDSSGRLYLLSDGVYELSDDGSSKLLFKPDVIRSIDSADLDLGRVVAVLYAESFDRQGESCIYDINSGKELSKISAPQDAVIYSAGKYFAAAGNNGEESPACRYDVFDKETGRYVNSYEDTARGSTFSFSSECDYGFGIKENKEGEPCIIRLLRLSDGAVAEADIGIDDAMSVLRADVGSTGRILLAVACGVGQKLSNVRIVMLEPSLFDFSESVKKCGPYSAPEEEHHKCGSSLAEVRKYADELENKYGVKILIGNEVLDLEGTENDYTPVSVEERSDPQEIYDITMGSLTALDEDLAMYPDDFLEKFVKNGKGGLCVAIADYITTNDSDSRFNAGGYAYTYGAWSVITICCDSLAFSDGSSFHHEMYHSVEDIVSIRYEPIDEDEWNSLNPEGFEYNFDFNYYADASFTGEYVYQSDDDPYFCSTYGKVTPMEDRATLVEGLFSDEYHEADEMLNRINSEYPHLKAKLDFIAGWTKNVYGYVYWEKMLSRKE